MNDAIDLAVKRAIAAGVLPEGARAPKQDTHPWPLILLSALGAWLAVLPLLGFLVVMLFLGMSKHEGALYLAGGLMLSVSLPIFFQRYVHPFLEQLAAIGLMVGWGGVAFGLFRYLPLSAAAGILAILMLMQALLVAPLWLQALSGTAAASLTGFALAATDEIGLAAGASDLIWRTLHELLLAWLAALSIQRAVLGHGSLASVAASVESIAGGWLLALLAGLALASGGMMLAGATPGGDFVRYAVGGGAWQPGFMPAASAALTLAGGVFLARRWRVLARPLNLLALVVLAALAWFLPTLGAVLFALALTAATRRFYLAGAAALAAVWITGSFYYQLTWPLGTKAAVLAGSGAFLGILAWLARQQEAPADAASVARPLPAPVRWPQWLIALTAVTTLACVNLAILQKEDLIAHGQAVYVKLAPVDPRSLMQGDYMALNFELPRIDRDSEHALPGAGRLYVAARRDARGIAELLRAVRYDTPLAPGEFRIELTRKNGRWMLVSDAWFFEEGTARVWERARYGEFRVGAHGKALLVGMADGNLVAIKR